MTRVISIIPSVSLHPNISFLGCSLSFPHPLAVLVTMALEHWVMICTLLLSSLYPQPHQEGI